MKKAADALPNDMLRREREQRGWSQKYVAEKIGSDTKTLGRWERGVTFPQPYYRQKLCELFEKNAQELGFLPENIEKSDGEQFNQSPPDEEVALHVPGNLSHQPVTTSLSIWSVPYRRNPFFTGREDILKRLHETLASNQAHMMALSQTLAVSGLGGIGKTQTALEYAYRYRNEYRAVLWVRADTREMLVGDFVSIAGLLNLPEKNEQDHNLTIRALHRWLQENNGWLLILDNADDLETVSQFMPVGGTGHILLTTREQVTGTLAQRIEMDTMEQGEGALFLLRRAKLVEPEAPLDTTTYVDWTKAKKIVRVMDGLPLALDQAAAYIEETECGLSGYLERYQLRSRQLLKRRGSTTSAHPEPVATTWSLSFERVAKANLAAADLLSLCAFLHPDAIPEEVITKGAPELGPALRSAAPDPLDLDSAIQEVRKYSLLRRVPDARILVIHRLVQAVLKDNMDQEMLQQWAERTVRAVNLAFPDVQFETWDVCERCLPHAKICATLIQQWHMTFPEASRLLHQAGSYLRKRAQYVQARSLLQQALLLREQSLGSEHIEVAEILHDLAILFREQDEDAQAELLFQRTLAIRERNLGAAHPDVAQTLDDLAILYSDQGKYALAEPLYQQALHIWMQILGPKHRSVADCLNDLGVLYDNQGKYAQAQLHFEQALSLRQEILGAMHPDTAQTLNNMAGLYYNQGNYSMAVLLFQQALAVWEQALGPEHPEVGTCLNNLGLLYIQQGKYALAESVLERALTIRKKALGQEHSLFASSLNNLALAYFNQGKYAEAGQLHQRSLALKEKIWGTTHPNVANSLNNLAEVYRAQKQYVLAEPLLQRALGIRKEILGAEHPAVAQSYHNLGKLYYYQSKYEQAEPLLQQALAMRERVLAPDHPDIARSLNDLASFYLAQDKYNQVEALARQALEIREKALGQEHPDVADSFYTLALFYKKQGRYTEAEPLLLRTLTIRENTLGSEHPDVATTLEDYTGLLQLMGKNQDEDSIAGM